MPEDSIVNNNEAGRVIYIYIYNTHASKAKQIALVKGCRTDTFCILWVEEEARTKTTIQRVISQGKLFVTYLVVVAVICSNIRSIF